MRFLDAFEVVFQAEYFSAKWLKMVHVHAHATAVFEDCPGDAFPGGGADYFESAHLPGTPDVGWFAAQGGFIQVALFHVRNYTLRAQSFFTAKN